MQVTHCHGGNNQKFTIESGGLLKAKSGQCVAVSTTDPGSGVRTSDFSLWAKPQPEGATAVFLMSNQNITSQKPSTVRVPSAMLSLGTTGWWVVCLVFRLTH